MITFLRQASSSILMRIVLATVVAALVLTLGISSFFIKNASKQPVAHVGSNIIAAADFAYELENKKHALKKHFGRPLSDQEALGLGLVNRTLSELITRELITQETDRVGIVASDEQLSKYMSEMPVFQDSTGKFSSQKFADYLNKTHTSERKYLDELRKQLSRGMLAGSLDAQLTRVPKIFTAPMFKYLNEERDVEVITVEVDKLPDLPKPEESVLKEFYEKHVQYFQAPETRSFDMLLLNFQEISQTINITPDDLRTLYQQTDNKVAEKRSVRMLMLPNREDSIKARTELMGGAPFEAVYNRYTGDLSQNAPPSQELELKQVIPEVGSEIFSMKKLHDVSEPVFLGGKYAIFMLTDIKPARTLSFDEQKFTLLKRYKTDLTREKMYDYTQRAEKMLNSGAKLSEIVEVFNKEGIPGVVLLTWNKVTDKGKNIEGDSVTGLSAFDPKILSTAFDTPQHTYSDPQKLATEDYVIVEVTAINPAHQRSFAEAVNQVERYWQHEQKRTQASTYVKNIKEGLEQFKDASKLAAANFGRIDVLNKTTRANPPQDPKFAGIFMQLNHTSSSTDIVTDVTANWVQIGRVAGTYSVNMDTFNAQAPNFVRQVMLPLMSKDLLSSYIAALEAYFPVSRNEEYFSNFFGKEELKNATINQAPDF
ncbi:MAG: SurA N-terminal domain-containing protein [Candidatus Paracaedibacteraceae bacterium]|nr:SurA N-terminal domain-containing protein [Candidatus Paracaedibacteraceae bacterium]